MPVFEIVVLIAAACGLAMVAGGIWLLAKGVLTLAATPKSDAITIEWRKQFRIHTQVPGLAFFVVGLMFVALSLQFSRPPDVVPMEFEGELKGVEGPVTVLVRPDLWQIPITSGGKLSGRIYPDLSKVFLVATAPGYEPFSIAVPMNGQSRRLAKLGTLELKRRIKEISATAGSVSNLSFTPPEVATAGQGAFGVPQ